MLGLLGACSSGPDPAPTAAPAPTSPRGSAPAPAATTPAIPSPSVTATPTGEPPVTGHRISDPTGDVSDPEGDPPPRGGTAADLTSADLERASDGGLVITLHLAGDVPPSADSLLWAVELDGDRRLTVAAQLTGGELSTGIYDHGSDTQHALPDAEVRGATVTMRVPPDELDGLGPDLRWWALTQLDGAYEDRTDPAQATG